MKYNNSGSIYSGKVQYIIIIQAHRNSYFSVCPGGWWSYLLESSAVSTAMSPGSAHQSQTYQSWTALVAPVYIYISDITSTSLIIIMKTSTLDTCST